MGLRLIGILRDTKKEVRYGRTQTPAIRGPFVEVVKAVRAPGSPSVTGRISSGVRNCSTLLEPPIGYLARTPRMWKVAQFAHVRAGSVEDAAIDEEVDVDIRATDAMFGMLLGQLCIIS